MEQATQTLRGILRVETVYGNEVNGYSKDSWELLAVSTGPVLVDDGGATAIFVVGITD